MGLKPSIKEGQRFLTKRNGWLEIIKYNSSTDIVVKFEDTLSTTNTNSVQIKRGTVKDKMMPSVLGIGFVGIGDEIAYIRRGSPTWSYSRWYNMLMRCYSENYHFNKEAYIGCSVDRIWHNFQLFSSWCKTQVGYLEAGWELDKDLLNKGNTTYSPQNSCFLPKELNALLIKTLDAKDRGKFVIGVQQIPKTGRYRVLCQGSHVGVYGSEVEAFESYKRFKESFIKQQAEKWKDKIDPRAYEALMNYQVEITD